MGKKNVMRVDDEFKILTNRFLAQRVMRGTDVKIQSERRFSKAVARLIERDIVFQEKLLNSPFEKDTLKRGGRRLKLR